MRPVYLLFALVLPLALACGGATAPPPEPEGPVIVPVPRMPDPPDISGRLLGDPEVDDEVARRLSSVNPRIRTCLHDRRPEIGRAKEPAAISVDVHVRRNPDGVRAEVTRSGFGNKQVVDDCVLGPLMDLNAEGLTFEVDWQVIADFP